VAALEGLPQAAVVADQDHRSLVVDQGFLELLGEQRREVVGRFVKEQDIDWTAHQSRKFEAAALAHGEGHDRLSELFVGEQSEAVEGFGVLFESADPARGERAEYGLAC
jgi:PAS domain-containing protein